jgi:hypothetical protein
MQQRLTGARVPTLTELPKNYALAWMMLWTAFALAVQHSTALTTFLVARFQILLYSRRVEMVSVTSSSGNAAVETSINPR